MDHGAGFIHVLDVTVRLTVHYDRASKTRTRKLKGLCVFGYDLQYALLEHLKQES